MMHQSGNILSLRTVKRDELRIHIFYEFRRNFRHL